jgi:hypothetical protein
MVVPLMITTSIRRALSTWRCVSEKACRSSPRSSLARRQVLGRKVASPTSLRLTRQVSASHDKSPPHTTSLHLARQVRIRLVRGPRHKARARPPTHAGKRISTSYGGGSWRPCRRPAPAGALNANLTSRAAITSPSPPLCHTQSPARGTRAPSTTRAGLDLGSRMARQASTRVD